MQPKTRQRLIALLVGDLQARRITGVLSALTPITFNARTDRRFGAFLLLLSANCKAHPRRSDLIHIQGHILCHPRRLAYS